MIVFPHSFETNLTQEISGFFGNAEGGSAPAGGILRKYAER